MSFHKMVFYLKEAHLMVRCDHAPLQKCVYSVTKNDILNNWSQEIHSITPHIEVKHIKGKENTLVDSLSRLSHLGLHEGNDPEESGHENGKSIFDVDEKIASSIDSDQNVNTNLEIDGIKLFSRWKRPS